MTKPFTTFSFFSVDGAEAKRRLSAVRCFAERLESGLISTKPTYLEIAITP
jgi:hypothetical protein